MSNPTRRDDPMPLWAQWTTPAFLWAVWGVATAWVWRTARQNSQVDKAAEWAASQAVSAGGTLEGYTTSAGAGAQYANYWMLAEIRQADANEQAKKGGP